jgi:hypothetical protein
MPHYKDTQNKLYWLDAGDDSAVWLPQCTPITDEEANVIRVAEQAALEASLTYAQKRASEYPSIPDQLDLLFHGGMDAWKAVIQTVKDKYPKA